MQAILSRYLPATNHKPLRIKASCARGSVIVSYDSALSDEAAHVEAAQTLINRFVTEDVVKYGTPKLSNPWDRPRTVGQLPNGDYAHVFKS